MSTHLLDSPIHQLARAHLKMEHGGFFPQGDPRMWAYPAGKGHGALDHLEGEEPVAVFGDRAKLGMFFSGSVLGSRHLVDDNGFAFDLTRLVTFQGTEEKAGGGVFTLWTDTRAHNVRLAAGKGWGQFFGRLTQIAPEDREGTYRELPGNASDFADELAFEDPRIDDLARFLTHCHQAGKLSDAEAPLFWRKLGLLYRSWAFGRGQTDGGLLTAAGTELPAILAEIWGGPTKMVETEDGLTMAWGDPPNLAGELAKTAAINAAGAALGALTGIGFRAKNGLKYWTARVRFHKGVSSVRLEGAKPLSGVLPLRDLDSSMWDDAIKAITGRELRMLLLRGLHGTAPKYSELVKLKDSDLHSLATKAVPGIDFGRLVGFTPSAPPAWAPRSGVTLAAPPPDLPSELLSPLPAGYRAPPKPGQPAPTPAPTPVAAPAPTPTRPAAVPLTAEELEARRLTRNAGLVQLGSAMVTGLIAWWAIPLAISQLGLPGVGLIPCMTLFLAPVEGISAILLLVGGPRLAIVGRLVAVLEIVAFCALDPFAGLAGLYVSYLLIQAAAATRLPLVRPGLAPPPSTG